ncbi:MAG: hypothetical protein M1816_000226 [Peltula sp. TS41687]|nr:MAG: hypothetical protein M1816_000226 [Peltula sp. TS41687]
MARAAPRSDAPVLASFSSERLTLAAGVAIFHVATARVVLCFHTREKHWFLPKGRRDVNEDSGVGAEREGFEESGYRNRLLPIPLVHRQPSPHNAVAGIVSPCYVAEPVWTQLLPLNHACQYLLFWYVAETLPPDVENAINARVRETQQGTANQVPYENPPRYPPNLTLPARLAMEPEEYKPVRHENTGVGADEAHYRSFLIPVEEAKKRLGGIQRDVVHKGWEAIKLRWSQESGDGSAG